LSVPRWASWLRSGGGVAGHFGAAADPGDVRGGGPPYPPAEVYRAYLTQADVFIGVYWQRHGQLVPGGRVSGLEEEFDLSGGLPRLLYVKAPAPDREARLADLLARIEGEASASYRHFRTRLSWAGWCVMTWRCC